MFELSTIKICLGVVYSKPRNLVCRKEVLTSQSTLKLSSDTGKIRILRGHMLPLFASPSIKGAQQPWRRCGDVRGRSWPWVPQLGSVEGSYGEFSGLKKESLNPNPLANILKLHKESL
jgi:hypothetical protein